MLFYANFLIIPPHTPSLPPSPARGMFRFGDMVSGVSFLDFTYFLQIFDKCFPLFDILFDIGLHLFIINEL